MRELGSPIWSLVREPSYQGDEWTDDQVRRDADETAEEIERMLADGSVSWEELGWGLADEEWLQSAWDRYGDRLIDVVAEQNIHAPILDDGGLRLARGKDLAANAARVIPPTRSGWAFFQGAAIRSTLKARDAREVAESWFQRAYKRGEIAARERVKVVGALLEQTNLSDVRKANVGGFSGGMKQRLGIAIARADGLATMVQIQDVRTWGEEANTLDFSADGLDLDFGDLPSLD